MLINVCNVYTFDIRNLLLGKNYVEYVIIYSMILI